MITGYTSLKLNIVMDNLVFIICLYMHISGLCEGAGVSTQKKHAVWGGHAISRKKLDLSIQEFKPRPCCCEVKVLPT